jgi:hypothetical protein
MSSSAMQAPRVLIALGLMLGIVFFGAFAALDPSHPFAVFNKFDAEHQVFTLIIIVVCVLPALVGSIALAVIFTTIPMAIVSLIIFLVVYAGVAIFFDFAPQNFAQCVAAMGLGMAIFQVITPRREQDAL